MIVKGYIKNDPDLLLKKGELCEIDLLCTISQCDDEEIKAFAVENVGINELTVMFTPIDDLTRLITEMLLV